MGNISRTWLPLRAERVVLRPLAEGDLDQLYELESDAWVKQYIAGGHVTEEKSSWLVKALPLCSCDHFFAIARASDNGFIGRATCGHYTPSLDSTNREIQVVLAREAIGDKLGVESCQLVIRALFEHLAARKIFAIVHPEHPRSPLLLDELGFRELSRENSQAERVFVLEG